MQESWIPLPPLDLTPACSPQDFAIRKQSDDCIAGLRVADGSPSAQSAPSLAPSGVDGDETTSYTGDNKHTSPWFQVEFDEPTQVEEMRVLNRDSVSAALFLLSPWTGVPSWEFNPGTVYDGADQVRCPLFPWPCTDRSNPAE